MLELLGEELLDVDDIDLDATNKEGNTALKLAHDEGHTKVMEMLKNYVAQ